MMESNPNQWKAESQVLEAFRKTDLFKSLTKEALKVIENEESILRAKLSNSLGNLRVPRASARGREIL